MRSISRRAVHGILIPRYSLINQNIVCVCARANKVISFPVLGAPAVATQTEPRACALPTHGGDPVRVHYVAGEVRKDISGPGERALAHDRGVNHTSPRSARLRAPSPASEWGGRVVRRQAARNTRAAKAARIACRSTVTVRNSDIYIWRPSRASSGTRQVDSLGHNIMHTQLYCKCMCV